MIENSKVFDCFTYFNEDMMLKIRLNELNKYVDKFCIVECGYDHQGNKKKQCFNLKKFETYKDKIEYVFLENIPKDILVKLKSYKWSIENFQRNYLRNLIDKVSKNKNDIVLISDLDEIPKLENIDLYKILAKKKFVIFQQKFFYYKLNYQNITRKKWAGTKACLAKNFENPQQIRDINTPKLIDIKKRFFGDIFILKDGGWHFSFVMSYDKISNKLMSYGHREYNIPEFTEIENIKKKILSGKDILNRNYQFKVINIKFLPKYIQKNTALYKEFLL